MVRFSASYFLWVARDIGYRLKGERRTKMYERAFVFKSIFGIEPDVCSFVYRLSDSARRGITPTHFPWGLVLANGYDTEQSYAECFHVTHKTFRKRSFQALQRIASTLPKIVSGKALTIVPKL